MPNARFGDYKMDLVPGYAVSLAWQNGIGINGNFFVYVVDRVSAPARPNQNVAFAKDGGGPVADLVIAGDWMNYTFRGITLMKCVVAATMSERVRVFEFRYPKEKTDAGKNPAELKNTSVRKLHPGAIGQDLQYSVSGRGGAEHLYGVSALMTPGSRGVVRLDTLRNSSNSLLEQMVESNTAAPQGGALKAFTINCSGMTLELSSTNLEGAFVTEAFGTCLEWGRPALSEYMSLEAGAERLSRAVLDGPTRGELLRAAMQGNQTPPGDIPMESATFCLTPGSLIDPKIA